MGTTTTAAPEKFVIDAFQFRIKEHKPFFWEADFLAQCDQFKSVCRTPPRTLYYSDHYISNDFGYWNVAVPTLWNICEALRLEGHEITMSYKNRVDGDDCNEMQLSIKSHVDAMPHYIKIHHKAYGF